VYGGGVILEPIIAIKQLGEICVVCEQSKPKGIHLYTSFICVECERSLVATPTTDPKYKYYISKLRKINKPEIFS
jgi:hypothetical protein